MEKKLKVLSIFAVCALCAGCSGEDFGRQIAGLGTADVDIINSDEASFGTSIAAADGALVVGSIDSIAGELENDMLAELGPAVAFVYDAQTEAMLHRLEGDPIEPTTHHGKHTPIATEVAALVATNGDVAVMVQRVLGCAFYDCSFRSDNHVYFFDIATGDRLGKIEIGDVSQTGAEMVSDQIAAPSFRPGRRLPAHGKIAMDGNLLAVGVPSLSENDDASGTVILIDVDTRTERCRFVAEDSRPYAGTGLSVAIADGKVLAGAPGYWEDGRHVSGRAYLFDAANCAQIGVLEPEESAGWSNFGYEVAMANGKAAILSSTTSHGQVFVFDVATMTQQWKLRPQDAYPPLALNFDFGRALATDGDVLAIGSFENPVYSVDLNSGGFVATASPGGDTAGAALALDGNRLFVGEPETLEVHGVDKPANPYTNFPGGDSTRDGCFDSSDFVRVFQGNKYETGEPATWDDGDWNGDRLFNSLDLVDVFAEGAYEQCE